MTNWNLSMDIPPTEAVRDLTPWEEAIATRDFWASLHSQAEEQAWTLAVQLRIARAKAAELLPKYQAAQDALSALCDVCGGDGYVDGPDPGDPENYVVPVECPKCGEGIA